MFYYKRLNAENQPFILKESFYKDFPTNNKYININEEEFNQLLKEKIPLENWSFYQFKDLKDLGIFCYNVIYPQFIKDLIKYCNLIPIWVNIENLIPAEIAYKDYQKKNFQFRNQYLNWAKEEHFTLLGEDILQKGMFFPFYGQLSSKEVAYGSHRLLSLLALNKNNKINKKFLFIQFPQICGLVNYRNNDYHNLGTIEIKIKAPLFDKNKQRLYLIETNSLEIIWNCFTQFSDSFGDYMYDIKDFISPHSFFNNEKDFEEFINDK